MLSIGLTGGIGSGKSVVAGMFRELGVPVIDADIISHQLVEPGSPLLKRLIDTFGTQYLKPDGSLDRKALAQTVFKNPIIKKQLEAMMHPAVRQQIRMQLTHHQDQPYVIVVIPLLVETGYTGLVDRVLVVDCDKSERLKRVLARDNRDEQQIRQIMRTQASQSERLRHADDVLQNDADISTLKQRVADLHQLYLHLSAT